MTLPSSATGEASAELMERRRRQTPDPRRQLELLEMAEELAQIGHWRVDLRDESVFWSAQVYRIHGRDPAAYAPTLAEGIDAYHPDDRPLVTAHLEAAIRDRTGFDFQLRLLRPDGEERLVHSRGRVECGPDGAPIAIFGVFQDVTDSHARALQNNVDLEGFARAASHELQSPLRSMLGFAALMEELYDAIEARELPAEARVYLERVGAGTVRVAQLVVALRTYASATRTEVGLEEIDLEALVHEVASHADVAIREADATVIVESLPTVTGVRDQLATCFEQLLDNALRYRAAGRPLSVRVGARRVPYGWAIVVEDDGRGFDPRIAERIFELFARGERSEGGDESRPLGLGLSICRRIVQAHGGTIRAQGWPDVGAAFELTLPDRERARSDRRGSRPPDA